MLNACISTANARLPLIFASSLLYCPGRSGMRLKKFTETFPINCNSAVAMTLLPYLVGMMVVVMIIMRLKRTLSTMFFKECEERKALRNLYQMVLC